MVSLIIAAAGSGSRFGYERNKLLYPLGGKPLLAYTIERSAASTAIGEILVVVSPKDKEEIQQIVSALQVSVPIRLLEGGKERQDSIWNALQALSDTTDIVLIHDGARPVADKEMYDTLIEAVREKQAVIYAVPVKNTIKKVNSHDEVMETVKRQSLRAVQTPQGFKKELLVRAYQYGKEKGLMVTDDASLVEAYGQAVHVLLGSYENRKVTTPEDIVMVEKALGISCVPRVGIGYDVHQLVEGRPLILGGVSIEHEKGLLGHSDADVLVHAIMDALLGAAGLKDIGTYFPDTSEQYRGISSILLLEQVGSILKEKGFAIHNVDAMVMAQRPKIGPHIDRMKENISQALGISLSSLSIKATTTERLGFVGKEEGMAAQAVVSLIGGRE